MSFKYLFVLVLILASAFAVLSVNVENNNVVEQELGNLEKKSKSYCYEISFAACLLHEETDKCCAWYGNKCHPTGACQTSL